MSKFPSLQSALTEPEKSEIKQALSSHLRMLIKVKGYWPLSNKKRIQKTSDRIEIVKGLILDLE